MKSKRFSGYRHNCLGTKTKKENFSRLNDLDVIAMKSMISPNWIRAFQVFIASTALSVAVVTIPTNEVLAQSKSPTIKQTISNLKQSTNRWIQVDLSQQRLVAWEGGKPVYAVVISSGKKSTPTRTGVFQIQTKLKSARMRGDGYDISKVPHTMYYQGGYAIHGAFWHQNFGTPVSHGCVNVAPNHAKWLFNWASVGTTVVVNR